MRRCHVAAGPWFLGAQSRPDGSIAMANFSGLPPFYFDAQNVQRVVGSRPSRDARSVGSVDRVMQYLGPLR